MEKREPMGSRFVDVGKAAEKRAEMDSQTQAKALGTVCPVCNEEFESPSKRDLHILDKHLGATEERGRGTP